MKVLHDICLTSFQWWGGAFFNAQQFTNDELEQLETILDDDEYPRMDEEKLNDIMWFEPEYFAILLGLGWDDEEGEIIRESGEGEEE